MSYNPLSWIRENLGPSVKESQTPEEIQAAKEEAKKAGATNLFEQVASTKATPPPSALKATMEKRKTPAKPKPDYVRYCQLAAVTCPDTKPTAQIFDRQL